MSRSIGLADKGVRMESQGKRSVVMDGIKPMPSHMERTSPAFGRASICALLCWMLWSTLLLTGIAQAQSSPAPSTTSNYVYDANGRLTAVTKGDGTSAPYTYDTLGNLLQVGGAIPAGQLALFTFTPSHGEAGTAITINGQGFSSALANDSVSFNGTVATVTSASPTQLVTSVPAGASSGPITVTVGGQVVSSTTPFVVDDTGLPPTISQIAPTLVAVGESITVTGSHLDPVTGNTTVQMGGRDVSLSSINDAQLQFVVPTTASSGHVTVQTPYGQATSSASTYVLPAGINEASVVSSGYATIDNSPVDLNIGGANQLGAVLFDANSGSWLSLQTSNINTTASNINYTIYGPGNELIQQGMISTSSPSIHLPQLIATGTYLAIFQPNTAGAQLTVNVQTDNTLTTAVALPINMAASWQSKRLLFTANAGDNLELTAYELAVSGSSSNSVTVSVYDPSGVYVSSQSCYTSNPGSSCRLTPLWNLIPGTYTAIITPPDASSTISFNAIVKRDVIGPTLVANIPTTATLGEGDVERLTFNATAGDTVSLYLSNVNTNPAGQAMYLPVFLPGAVTTTNIYTVLSGSGSNTINLSNLPVSGTYTVVASIIAGTPGSAQLTLIHGVTGTVVSGGSSQNYVAAAPGQSVGINFSANNGDNLELTLYGLTISGSSSNSVSMNVYDSSSRYISSVTCSTSSPGASCRLPLWNLAAGNYAAVIAPSDTSSTIGFDALLKPDVIGPMLVANTPTTINLGEGDVERLTFNANAGDTVTLNLSGVSTTPTGQAMYVPVFLPGSITTNNIYAVFNTDSSNSLTLSNLPVSGTYTVFASIISGTPGSAQVTLVPQ